MSPLSARIILSIEGANFGVEVTTAKGTPLNAASRAAAAAIPITGISILRANFLAPGSPKAATIKALASGKTASDI